MLLASPSFLGPSATTLKEEWMKSQYGSGATLLCVAAVALSACGGSSKSSGGSKSPSSVQACLQRAGYGITVVPTSDVTGNGGESRGPGQTGELLVGEQGGRPHVGADDADAVVAFWDSHTRAANSPNAKDEGIGTHADTFGSITVQPTVHLVLFAVRSAGTPKSRRTKYFAEVKKIESCAR
jgi:hypothetical protein